MEQDEVKLEQQQLKLPHRNCKTIDQLKYHKLTTNMMFIKTPNQSKHIHMYQIQTQPSLPTNYSNRNVVGYINKRIGDHLNKFVYVKPDMIITTTLLATNKKSLKLVYGNSPYQVWLIHHKSISIQSINSSHRCSAHHRKSKSYFHRMVRKLLIQLNFTNSNRTTHYLPQLEYNSLLNCSILQTFKTTFNYHQQSLLLAVKRVNKFIKEESVLDDINIFYKTYSNLDKDEKRILLKEKYKCKKIISNYGKKTIYQIEQLVFGININQIYLEYNNKKLALPQYYLQKYQLGVNNFNQPLIKAKGKKLTYLIPQFMSFMISYKQMDLTKRQQFIKHTKLSPNQQIHQNNNFLMNLKQPIKTNPFDLFKCIGIQLNQYTQLNSYELDLPTIRMKEKKFSFEDEQIYQAQIDLNICLICCNQFNLNNLKNDIVRYTNKCGISYNFISYTYLKSSKEQIIYDIKKIVYFQKYTVRKNMTNMFWIIIPNNLKCLYSKLKEITFSTNISIPSQITLQSTIQPSQNSKIIQKILYQMAAKIGNRLWIIDRTTTQTILMIGIALTNNKDGQMIVAYCSNIDQNISVYYSHFYVEQPYSSLSLIIQQIVSESIQEFVKVNQNIPNQIIILRFQNSKISQEQQAAQSKQIQKAINNINLSRNKSKINYYALSYSHTLQVYLKSANSFGRPFQGMLIDSTIVDNGNFYIIHQSQNNQTVIIFYRKIYSNSFLCDKEFKQLMYNQTFNYFNFKGTSYIPSVLKYAYKLVKSLMNYQCKDMQVSALRYNLYFL